MASNDRVMPGADRDEDSGKFTETYPTGTFPDAIEALGGSAGTQEVADEVGCSYQLAYTRLQEVADEGVVEKRKVGNALLWMVADDL